MVSPGQLVPTPPKGNTPARDRQRSVPGQLIPPCTGRPVHQGAERQLGADKDQPQVKWSALRASQPIPKQLVIRADPPVVALATLDHLAVPDLSYVS